MELHSVQRKEEKHTMKFVKFLAIAAFAVSALSLGACASKPAPAPVTTSYSK